MRHCLLAAFLFLTPALADESAKERPRKDGPEVVSLSDGRYRIGNVILDPARRAIEVKGQVNMQEGLVELLACTPTGKTHESVLALEVVPLHMQVALLALGLKSGRNPGVTGEEGDRREPGDRVEVRVSWVSDGKPREVRAEEMIWHAPENHPMPKTDWVFLGSEASGGVFAADETGSLITTYHDPLAIVENPLATVNDDTLYFANPRVVPPVGTPVTVTIAIPKR